MKHELTQNLLDQAQKAFAKYGVKEEVPVGTKVIVEGELTEHLYYVIHGELKTYGVTSIYPFFLGKVQAGQIFGDASFLLGGRTATATVMASTKCEIYKISFDKLKELLKENHPDAMPITFFLAHMLAVRVRRMDVKFFKRGLMDEHIFHE